MASSQMSVCDVFTPQNMLNWKIYLREQGYPESTIARKLRGVQTCWRVLHRVHLVPVPAPSAEEIGIPKKQRVYTDSLNQEEFIRFASTPPWLLGWDYPLLNTRDEVLFALHNAVPTSARAICRLDLDDLYLADGVVNFDGNRISLPRAVITKLEEYIRASDRPASTAGPLFLSRTGQRIDHNAFRKAFHRHLATCRIPPTAKADILQLSPEQRALFLSTPVSSYSMSDHDLERAQLILDLLCWLGLRPSEIQNLHKEDVRLSGETRLILRTTKSKEPQELPIPVELAPRLTNHINSLDPEMPVFQTSTGKAVDRRDIHEMVCQHGQHCQIALTVNPRVLRRSLSRLLVDNGATQEQVGLLLRHYEYRTTTTAISYVPIRAQHIARVFDFHPLRLIAKGEALK